MTDKYMSHLKQPGIKMVYPELCKELRRRPQPFMVGIVPDKPSSTRVLIVAQMIFSIDPHPPSIEGGPVIDPVWCQTRECAACLLVAVAQKTGMEPW